MPVYTYTLSTTRTQDIAPDASRRHSLPLDAVAKLEAFAAGMLTGTLAVQYSTTSNAAAQAAGTITLSSASGTLTATINGVAVTATASGGDTNSATLLKNAINASVNALVAGIVSATSSGAVVTISAIAPGKVGNAITLAGSGTGVTASGARLTGGVGGDVAAVSATF